jgi:hypothetical protein
VKDAVTVLDTTVAPEPMWPKSGRSVLIRVH